MPLLNQADTSRLRALLQSVRERSLDTLAPTFYRAFAPGSSIQALACLTFLLKVSVL